jgi:hypothetical protein
MLSRRFFTLICASLIIFTSACTIQIIPAGPGVPTLDLTAEGQTQVAEIVASTLEAGTEVANAVAKTLAALATNTPEFTFTPSLTSTPTFTFTPAVPMVSVSVETNCRSGPGKPYDILGVLQVGVSAEVVGQVSGGGSWIIRLPSNPAIICWVWTQYATVVGNTTGLPFYTPPPTPTPVVSYTVVFVGVVHCAPDYAFRFSIINNGNLIWESIRITVTDNTVPGVFTHTLDDFRSYNGCVLEQDQQDLAPGETGLVTNVNPGQFPYNPAGHNFTVAFKLCSENGLAATCLEKAITINP